MFHKINENAEGKSPSKQTRLFKKLTRTLKELSKKFTEILKDLFVLSMEGQRYFMFFGAPKNIFKAQEPVTKMTSGFEKPLPKAKKGEETPIT